MQQPLIKQVIIRCVISKHFMSRIKKQDIVFTLKKEPLVTCSLEIMHRHKPGKILAVYELVFHNTPGQPFKRQDMIESEKYFGELLAELPRKNWNRRGIRDLVRDFMSEIPQSVTSMEIKHVNSEIPDRVSSLYVWHARNGNLLFACICPKNVKIEHYGETYEVSLPEKEKLSLALCGRRLGKYDLMKQCENRFAGEKAFFDFKKYLDEKDVVYQKVDF